MTSSEFGQSQSPEQQLAVAKDKFRRSILGDDAFFTFLQTQLPSLGERERYLPDFGLEPTIKRHPDNTSDIGIRIIRSGQIGASGITSSIKVYNHVPLFVVDNSSDQAKSAPNLEVYLVGSHQTSAGELIFRKWQEAARNLQAELPAGITLDDVNGTFELESAEQRNTPNNN